MCLFIFAVLTIALCFSIIYLAVLLLSRLFCQSLFGFDCFVSVPVLVAAFVAVVLSVCPCLLFLLFWLCCSAFTLVLLLLGVALFLLFCAVHFKVGIEAGVAAEAGVGIGIEAGVGGRGPVGCCRPPPSWSNRASAVSMMTSRRPRP